VDGSAVHAFNVRVNDPGMRWIIDRRWRANAAEPVGAQFTVIGMHDPRGHKCPPYGKHLLRDRTISACRNPQHPRFIPPKSN